jgi:hypothetical protein
MLFWEEASIEGLVTEAVDWLLGALHWLGNLLDSVGEILGDIAPPVFAGIAAIALLRIVRWLLLLWRGRTPRVQITSFAWATSEDTHQEATWVTSLFREQLAALRLDALDPLPERAPGAPLVEIVEGVGQGVGRDIGAAAGRLFRAIWPDSAYEVWGSLRPRQGGGGRISVQLIERRRGNRTLLNVALEQASWEDGAREAALAVAGALYPRVRRSDRGPWTMWRRAVPRELTGHYHAARRYEEDNRLEQALAGYHAALELDPLNPNLRLKIAMLQERLELYLDAWVTYEAIVDESERRAWRGPDRRVYLLALYRLAVMLSNGQVAAQWVKGDSLPPDQGTRRDRERHERRQELVLSLECNHLFARHRIQLSPNQLPERLTWTVSNLIHRRSATLLMTLLRWIDHEAQDRRDVLAPFAKVESEDSGVQGIERARAQRIEAVLQILGLRRLEELETALRIRPSIRGWREWWIRHAALRRGPRRSEFPKSALRTSKLLVRTRIAASLESEVERRAACGDFRNRDRWIEEIREGHRQLTKQWPFPPANPWRTVLHFVAPRRRWDNERDDAWQIHYNAACATASLVRDDSVLRRFEAERSAAPEDSALRRRRPLPDRTTRQRVVRRAVAQLEEYAFRAGSDRVAAQADWVALDDPDLRGLRRSAEFRLWASHHLPRALPEEGAASRKADVKRFTIRVVHEGACIFAAAWRERAAKPYPSAAEVVEWWRTEAEIWKALGNACREHLSWQERRDWLIRLQDWLARAAREETVDFSHEARGAAVADSMSEGLFEELAKLAGSDSHNGGPTSSGTSAPSVVVWLSRRVDHVCEAHEIGEEVADDRGVLRGETEREAALRAARLWTRLAEGLKEELTGPVTENSDEELARRIARIRAQVA